jgi:ribonuclease III
MFTNIQRLQELLNYRFKQPELGELALCHSSLLAEQVDLPVAGNQRLELLGDAVIGLVLAEFLYHQFPEAKEGFISRTRSILSSGETLAACARRIGLGALLMVSQNEARRNPERTDAMLGDALEAVIGAVFLDSGYVQAVGVVQHLLSQELADCLDGGGAIQGNPKGVLQEYVQAIDSTKLPHYATIAEEGPDHDKRYTAKVDYMEMSAIGLGKTRKAAEAEAATALLEVLHKTTSEIK